MGLFREAAKETSVFVDGQLVRTDEVASCSDLIRAVGHDPSTHTLAMEDKRGVIKLIPAGRLIRLADGQKLETSLTGIGG